MNAKKIVSDMRGRLVKHRGHFRDLCKETGLDYSWLSKFANGRITNPTIGKLEELDKALGTWDKAQAKAA